MKAVRDLESPHAALRKLLDADARRAEKFREHGWAWDKPLFAGGFERRRLKILNTLASGLAKVGARFEVRGSSGREIHVTVGVTTVPLALDHHAAKPNRHGEWQTRDGPADELKLIIGKGKSSDFQSVWLDDEGGKLEAKLSDVALEIVVAGEATYRQGCVDRHTWLLDCRARLETEVRKRREEAERQARERRLAEEKARRDHLFVQAQAWRTAQDIRGFVAEVLATPLTEQAAEDVRRWATWALSEANAIDPAVGGLRLPDGT